MGRSAHKVSPSSCKETLAEIDGAKRGPLPKCKYAKGMTGQGTEDLDLPCQAKPLRLPRVRPEESHRGF